MKKKIFIILTTIVFMLSVLLPMTSFAATTTVTLEGPATTKTGKQISVNLIIDGTDIYGVTATLSYDETQLTFIKAENPLAGWDVSFNGNNLYAIDNTLSAPINKKQVLCTLVFQVSETATNSKAIVSINNMVLSAGDKDIFASASYSVTVASAKSADATLKSLAVDGQTLTPAFSSDVTGYQVNVANGATAVKVSAKANDSNAKVTVSGGSKLAVGENTVKVVVTAEAGNQNTYVIKVVRAAAEKPPVSSKSPVSSSALSSNAQLATLKLTDVNLPFSPTVREYAVKVPNEQKTVEIEATAKEKNAKINILVNNQKITDGVGELKVGANYVIVQVTAPDGTTTRSYNIVVTRESAKPSSQAPSSAPVSSRPVSSQGSSSESASSAEASSQMTSSETVTSVPSSSNPVSSETVSTESDSSAQSSVSSEGVQSVESEAETPSSPGDSSGNTFLDWLKKDRSDLALHAAYIGGMIICLLAGCMLGYYLRGRKKEK